MTRVDAQIMYTFPSKVGGGDLSVYANFNNLSDETDVRFAGNGTVNQSELRLALFDWPTLQLLSYIWR